MDWHETSHPPDLAPAPMQQHGAYGRACGKLDSSVLHFSAGPRHHPWAHAQVLVRHWPLFGDFALLARGPVWTSPVSCAEARLATRRLVTHLRDNCRGVIVTAETVGGTDPMMGEPMLPLVTAGAQARLCLKGSSEDRLARQHGKWRNRLRRAQASNLRITHGPLPADPKHWLLTREAQQSRDRGYRRLPPSFTHAWRVANGARSTRLFTATNKGDPVAAMLFLVHGDTASYHVGWSGDAGRATHAHNLLLWTASEWLAERGCQWVDLGTLETERTPGLARFKLGAGAHPVMLGTTWMDAPLSRVVARMFAVGNRLDSLPA